MIHPPLLTLTREVRFGLHDAEPLAADIGPHAANGFAANPPLTGLAPFLLLRASLTGAIDPTTGMLINIKIVDALLRQHAVPCLRNIYYSAAAGDKAGGNPALFLSKLFVLLSEKFAPHVLSALTLAPSPFLSFAIDHKEPQMVRTSQRFEFSAAHRLHSESLSEKQNWEIFGRCNNPNGHGHNYEIEVTLAGAPDAVTGDVLPGGILQLQRLVNDNILDRFDHKHLNLDCAEFRSPGGLNPTVENIARVIFEKLKPAIPAPARLQAVKVWETPKTVAEFSE